jgi:hypothetical protein
MKLDAIGQGAIGITGQSTGQGAVLPGQFVGQGAIIQGLITGQGAIQSGTVSGQGANHSGEISRAKEPEPIRQARRRQEGRKRIRQVN